MKLKMFSVFDVKADVYLTPFFFPANGQAVRAFADLANDRNTIIGRHPGDYKLCYLGDFDDCKADFEPSGIVGLGWASDFVALGNVTPLGVSNAG